jgi:hypothetical protein
MSRRLPFFLLLLLALIPIATRAAETDDNAAIVAAAKAYLNKEGYAKTTKVKVEAVAKGFARVLVTPADGQTDPAIMFLQKKDGTWRGLTIGTGFAPDDLDELKIPEAIRPE